MSKEHYYNIKRLLKKYNNNYINGEQRTPEVKSEYRKYSNYIKNYNTCVYLLKKYKVKEVIKKDVLYWINKLQTIKFLNRKWSREKCLASIILIQTQFEYCDDKYRKKIYDYSNYTIWKDYGFTWDEFSIVKSRFYKKILKEHVIMNSKSNVKRYHEIEEG